VTLGSEVEELCDIAGPPRPHSNAIDRSATAEGATRLDDILITRSPNPEAVLAESRRGPNRATTIASVPGGRIESLTDRRIWAVTDILIA
jgi:hypothetical protein